jgi:hypothetical protein
LLANNLTPHAFILNILWTMEFASLKKIGCVRLAHIMPQFEIYQILLQFCF